MARGEPTKTIAHAKAAGETRFTVYRERQGCGHRAEMAFDQLRLPDDAIFVHIPQLLNFVCSKCQSRDVKIMPIFPAARGTPSHGESRAVQGDGAEDRERGAIKQEKGAPEA